MDLHPSNALPASVPGPEDVLSRQRRLDDRDARLLTALTVFSAVAAAFCLVLAFQVSQQTLRGSAASVTGADAAECREGEAPSRCSEGEVCQSGVCTSPGAPTRCEPGALCDSCSCDHPLTCDGQGVCVLPRAAGLCSDEAVLDFLEVLQQKCGDVRKCESKDLDKHAVSYPDFLELIGRFPNTLAIHFPDGQPGLTVGAARWPTPQESEHYVNRLRSALSDLEPADRILLVGLASKDRRVRGSDANKAITLQRLIAAQNLINRAATTGLGAAKADAIEGKISIIHMGDKRSVDAALYGSLYGNRPIAWDLGTEQQLRYLVEHGNVSGTPEDIRWRDRTLNQVVFVVPIHCKTRGPS